MWFENVVLNERRDKFLHSAQVCVAVRYAAWVTETIMYRPVCPFDDAKHRTCVVQQQQIRQRHLEPTIEATFRRAVCCGVPAPGKVIQTTLFVRGLDAGGTRGELGAHLFG